MGGALGCDLSGGRSGVKVFFKNEYFIKDVFHYHPCNVLNNKFFENILDTTDEWITRRTGIEERRYLSPPDSPLPAHTLAKRVLKKIAPEHLEGVELVISAGSIQDLQMPSLANMIALEINRGVPAFHVNNGCSSGLTAINVAVGMMETMNISEVLVVVSEPYTRITDYSDRGSAIIWGDASAAILLSSKAGKFRLGQYNSFGEGSNIINTTATAATPTLDLATVLDHSPQPISRHGVFKQDGRRVYSKVVREVPPAIEELLRDSHLTKEDIDYFIGHQANLPMLKSLLEKTELNETVKHLYNLNQYGNTGAAGWLTVLSENKKHFKTNEKILVSVFGAGFSWGNLILESL